MGPKGARILNLPLHAAPNYAHGRVSDPDYVVRLAQRDVTAATASLIEQLTPLKVQSTDWPQMLATDLSADQTLRLSDWAVRHGLARETLARGFRQVFGITPAAFRAEARAHAAWRDVAQEDLPLAQIAGQAGFADQSHMTRAIVSLTGCPPVKWRRRGARLSSLGRRSN
jgi:AraC-like DNA-binding protein